MKESVKKLVSSTSVGHVEMMGGKTGREQMPRQFKGNGGEEDRNCVV